MIFTNKLNLPEPLYQAIVRVMTKKERVADFSVTELIKPPQMLQLERRHDAEIKVDVSDCIWLLLGQAVHAVLEFAGSKHTTEHHIEETLVMEIDGVKISGTPDVHCIAADRLSDYKITSVWAFLKGEKPEWVKQLNVYAWMLRGLKNVKVESLEIVAILRDWSVTRTYEPDYPEKAVAVVPIERMTDEAIEEYAGERVKRHKIAAVQKDDGLPACTAEERWEKPTTYVVQKPGAKRAIAATKPGTKLPMTEEEASQEALKHPGSEVVCRQGTSVRCSLYCRAFPFCRQGKWLVPPQDRQAAGE